MKELTNVNYYVTSSCYLQNDKLVIFIIILNYINVTFSTLTNKRI